MLALLAGMEAKGWRMLSDVARLFYPVLCPGCGVDLLEAETYLCVSCMSSLPRTDFGALGSPAAARIFQGRVKFRSVYSYLYFRKNGLTQKLLHHIKYRGAERLANRLGMQFGAELEAYACPDILVPVPLHASRLRKRGYNQAEAIAKGMGSVLCLPVISDLLWRTGAAQSQTKASRILRWGNVSEGFLCRSGTMDRKVHIGLVDDVLTTGATLEACVLALRREGYEHFSAYTLALAEH